MGVIWKKLWADLWHHKARTILATLSIAVGVLALGFILGMMDQLSPTWNKVHRSIVPHHIYMGLSRPIDRDTVDALRHIDGVAGIEPMSERAIRYRRAPDEPWRDGVLMMRDDYEHQRYNLLQLKAGTWPRHNTVDIDFRSAESLGLDLGDQVIFELDGTDRALPISGKIRYHFIAAPEFGFDSHFFVDGPGMERFGGQEGTFQRLMIRVTPYSEAHARAVASAIKDRLSALGVSVGLTHYNNPDEHWAQQFVDGLYVIMQMLAVMALFMSVVLIYNTLAALITQQTNQIGIIKAIGGRTSVILRLYLTGVLVYGALALLIAFPIGAVLSAVMTAYFLNIFNVAYGSFQVSPRALAVQALAALLVPLLAALWPVLSGARITVRQAIASYGLGGGAGASWLDRAIERLGSRWLAAPVALAVGNMFRRKGRLALTQVVLITAGALYLIVMTLSSSIDLTVNTELARHSYQTQLTFAGDHRIGRLEALATAQPGVVTAEAWLGHPANLLRAGQSIHEAGAGTILVGLPPASGLYRPRIVAGRWLLPEDERAIVLNEETAEENGIQPGDLVTLDLGDWGDDLWRVVGLYRVLSIRPAPENIYAPREALLRASSRSDRANMLLVRMATDDPATAAAITRGLESLFERCRWDISDTATVAESRQFFDSFFAQYIPMLLALAVITAVVGGIGLMGALSIAVVERTREIGVLRAIGATTPDLLRMLMLEGVAQGLFSWAVAVPLSFVFGRRVAALMGQALFSVDLDYQYNSGAVLLWLAAVLLIAVLASLLPARSATRVSVRASLAYA